MTDIGVLLPVRLETRFSPGWLRLRVVPDEPWFVRHDPRYQDGELAALARYLDAVDGVPVDPTAGGPAAQAWTELVGHVGGPRAVYLLRTATVAAADGRSKVRVPAAGERADEPALPSITGFPAELDVWLVRRGAPAPERVATLAVDRSRLLADFPDPDLPGDRRWWEDWDEAVAVGLAVEIPLDAVDDIELLCVTGLGDGAPAELLAGHRDAGRLGLLAPGEATNSVDGAGAAPLGNDPLTWWSVYTDAASPDGRALAAALTGDPAALGPLPGAFADEPRRDWASALVTGLWPALWGYAGTDVWAVPAPAMGATAAWAAEALLPEGPFPTLRCGPQPYGVLPATVTTGWVAAPGDPDVEAPLLAAGGALRARLAAAAEQRGTTASAAPGAGAEELLDLLADVPTSPHYRHRRAWSLESWWLLLVATGHGVTWEDLDRKWHDQYPLAGELGLTPERRYGTRGPARRVDLPTVVPPALPEAQTVGGAIDLLLDTAVQAPSLFASTELIDQEVLRFPADSLLLRLVIRSLQVALGDVGRERAGEVPPGLEPPTRPVGVPGRLEGWVASLQAAHLQQRLPSVVAFRRVAEGLRAVASIPVDRLDGLVRATVDTATHRIDPWLVGPVWRRLRDLVAGGAAEPRLGAYGWVDAPRPGTPGPTAGGLLHAPSPGQALTATVLRDRAVNDPEPARWALDLSSSVVRVADRLAEHVRVGAHLSEALGREVERVVDRPDDVARLRRDFPVRTEHAGRRVCDGQQVLAAVPGSLGLPPAVLAGLDDLRSAVEAYGDLLVAEAVHHVTQGRAETAGAVMDAAAGLSRPPHLELLQTPRQGRAVATTVVVVLPAGAEPALPTPVGERALVAPAALADPATASFLAAQLGPASSWTWTVGGSVVTLGDLGLTPADSLSLARSDLERLALEAGAAALGVPVGSVALGDAVGSEKYEAAARLVGVVGRAPAGPDAVAAVEPDGIDTGPVDDDLRQRYQRVHQVASALVTALDGGDPAALVAARSWGIAPEPPDPARARELLMGRLMVAPAPAETGGLGRADLVAALTALVSPTGQLAVTARLPRSQLPVGVSAVGAGLDGDWLPVVAAVREPLARLEAHQLAAGTGVGAGPALVGWSTKPGDPWQTDPADGRRLVVAYAPAGLDLAAVPGDVLVGVAAVDRWTEVVPDEEQVTAAAFGFDAPAARPPQAVLLAVPPDLGAPLDAETLLAIVRDTRELAHARMARTVDLPDGVRGLLPAVLFPAAGAIATPLTPTR